MTPSLRVRTPYPARGPLPRARMLTEVDGRLKTTRSAPILQCRRPIGRAAPSRGSIRPKPSQPHQAKRENATARAPSPQTFGAVSRVLILRRGQGHTWITDLGGQRTPRGGRVDKGRRGGSSLAGQQTKHTSAACQRQIS